MVPIEVIDPKGVRASITVLIEAMINSHPTLSRDILDHWYRWTPEERSNKLSVSLNYEPPVGEPMRLAQGSLIYPLKRLKYRLDVEFAAGAVELRHSDYRQLRVAHGLTHLLGAHQPAQSVHIAVTEQPGKNPIAAIVPVNDKGEAIAEPRTMEFLITEKK
jgi:hypothetical protein